MTAPTLIKPDVGIAEAGVRETTSTAGIAPRLPFLRRVLKHPRLKHYNRLVALAMIVNLGWAVYGAAAADWWTADGADLSALALMAQTNLAAAVLFRQQYILNALAWLVTRPPTSWPLRVRWALGKYYHFGGLHVGAALAGTLWYMALVVSMIRDAVAGVGEASYAHMILGTTIATTFTVMVVMALPRLRAAHHDRFEVTHRFCGWAALVLVWINTMLFVNGDRGDRSFGSALLTAPCLLAGRAERAVGRLAVAASAPRPGQLRAPVVARGDSASRSRRAPCRRHHPADQPSALLGVGTTSPTCPPRRARPDTACWSRAPVTGPRPSSTNRRRMCGCVVSRRWAWPTCAGCSRKVVLVATGSGIGPVLGHLLDTSVPSRLVWVTKNPRLTYGDAFVDEIEAAQPDAMIWDTGALGKPDVLQLAYAAYVESGAEAVICVSNRTVTWQVVHGLERCGIPAFGPIWDS